MAAMGRMAWGCGFERNDSHAATWDGRMKGLGFLGCRGLGVLGLRGLGCRV